MLTVPGLCQPYAEHAFLRDVLGYKRPWVYYLAMFLDPILRFNWIFYAIYSNELQHSALLSFFVGFSEVCRRGMWTLFRVENEHCTNVGRFRASRDVPLPYEIGPPSPPTPVEPGVSDENQPPREHPGRSPAWWSSPSHGATSSTLEAQPPSPSLRRRGPVPNNTPIQRGIARVGTMIGQAHAQDFEKKRRPGGPEPASPYHGARTAPESSDDEEEEDGDDSQEARENATDMQDAENILRRRRSATDA